MTEDVKPVIGISINTELPGKRSVVFQTHVAQDTDPKALNALLDKLQDANDRQFSRYLLEVMRVELEQHEKMLADQVGRIQVVESNLQDKSVNHAKSGRRNGYVLSEKEQQEKRQAHQNLEAIKERVETIKSKIAEHEAVVGA